MLYFKAASAEKIESKGWGGYFHLMPNSCGEKVAIYSALTLRGHHVPNVT